MRQEARSRKSEVGSQLIISGIIGFKFKLVKPCIVSGFETFVIGIFTSSVVTRRGGGSIRRKLKSGYRLNGGAKSLNLSRPTTWSGGMI